jgi:hypothetical protein
MKTLSRLSIAITPHAASSDLLTTASRGISLRGIHGDSLASSSRICWRSCSARVNQVSCHSPYVPRSRSSRSAFAAKCCFKLDRASSARIRNGDSLAMSFEPTNIGAAPGWNLRVMFKQRDSTHRLVRLRSLRRLRKGCTQKASLAQCEYPVQPLLEQLPGLSQSNSYDGSRSQFSVIAVETGAETGTASPAARSCLSDNFQAE